MAEGGEDKKDEIRQEALKKQQNKTELEQTVASGVQGGWELNKEEKSRFLGEFRERVLIALTKEKVEAPGTFPEVIEAIKDPEAEKLIIDRSVDMGVAREYIQLAREYNLSFKKVSSPEFKGPIKLVIVSDGAVNRSSIAVQTREERLKEKGVPEELIAAQGEKICKDCYKLISNKAPEEIENYKQLSWFDKLMGINCSGAHNNE